MPVREDEKMKTLDARRWYVRLLICCASFFIVLGIVFLAFYVLGMEPFGSRTLTTDDAKIQYIDFFTYFVDVLHGTRTISYDFGNMLGWSPLGLFSYYLASPFNLLLLIFGKEGVYRFFNVAIALKLGTAGATFSWYLQRRFEDRIYPAFVIALSMGYALMQYTVQQSSNIMWLDGVYMLPLIMLGVYEVLHKKSVWRLALPVAFCIFCNWYIAGVSCLFSGIWFVFEYFFLDEGAFREKSPAKAGLFEKKDKKEGAIETHVRARRGDMPRNRFVVAFTEFFLSFCRYVWGMGLGVALSAVLFLPVISAMRQGKGQYDNVKIVTGMYGDLLSAVRGYVIGADSTKGHAALFCGGIALIAAAAVVFSGEYRIRQKVVYVCMAGICFLMLHWEPAMLAFSLFSRADSYWYRYGYLLCFVILFGAAAYLSRAEQDRWSKFFVPVLSVLYASAVLKLNGIHFTDFMAQGPEIIRIYPAVFATAGASILLSVLAVILTWGKKERPSEMEAASPVPAAGPEESPAGGEAEKPAAVSEPAKGGGKKEQFPAVRLAAALLLIVVTGAELWANARILWQHKSDDSQELYLAYSEGLQAQLAALRALDGGYYRIAQDRTRWHYEDDDLTAYLNESLAQNYWSNAAYTSSPDNAQLSLMWRLGYRDEAGRMLIVRDPVLPSDAFLGVKYLLESTPIRGLERMDEIGSFSGRSVYRNPYAVPMAFVYDGAKLPTRHYENTFVYQNALFSTLTGRKTELYTPLSWTRYNEGDKSYYSIFVPEGNYLAYGNLLWSSKKTGMMSINGAKPYGYCRWMSPAAFLIRSREEQAQSEEEESLQAVRKRAAAGLCRIVSIGNRGA